MKYIPTIGIECHVQLKTRTKLFAAVNNDAREAPPNTLISHICVGLPGALPFLNKKALELAARAAFALNTKPQTFSKFDRKHYFYPDLPKGYQITQYEQPIIIGGYVDVPVNSRQIRVGIERVNLEEDAGKNIHPAGADYSLVDLNRAGTPLLEIVSKPEIHNATEAKAFAREMWLLMKYADVTEGDMYHGHVRFDVNISVSQNPNKLGTRSEIKNLNSFRSVEGAVAYEIERQIELLEKGGTVVQETRGWDEAKQKTTGQREKEEAHDYRYMPEPDIPPIGLTNADIAKFKKDLPKLPTAIRSELARLDMGKAQLESLIEDVDGTKLILEKIAEGNLKDASDTAKWWTGPIQNATVSGVLTREQALSDLAKSYFTTVSGMLSDNLLSSTNATIAIVSSIKDSRDPREFKNLLQVSDESEIEKIVAEAIKENSKVAADVKAGQTKAIGFLVGQVMAKSQGKANPGLAQQIIKKQLGI
ncbi:MAG: Asp-tRNA(Asn)/Glu-tRNA(Gln) amidotransferase subunit GatB [Candidatus Saccharimonadales bacterium]|jgi:aspartyl-tRNA(Asn)/glutamyl-tRNA(Gln) amidotransferase subunit B